MKEHRLVEWLQQGMAAAVVGCSASFLLGYSGQTLQNIFCFRSC
jgi:hypothetical protein